MSFSIFDPLGAAHQVVSAAMDIDLIYADQGKPMPNPPFAAIRAGRMITRGHVERRGVDANGNELLVEPTAFNVELQFIGPDAQLYAHNTRMRLQSESVMELAESLNISITEIGPANNITTLRDSQYEARYVLEFVLNFTGEFIDNVGLIEYVVIDGSPDFPTVQVDIP